MAFRVGMKVVCVETLGSNGGHIPILKGKVLTIREIVDDGDPEGIGLRFDEIVQPFEWLERWDGVEEFCEGMYCYTYFRPVRTTSIEVFEKLLAPQDVHA
jgi:hypothetical protein